MRGFLLEKEMHPLDILYDRCRDLSARVCSGNLKFIDAVDMAYSAADFAGLVDVYGDDLIQSLLADAFSGARTAA